MKTGMSILVQNPRNRLIVLFIGLVAFFNLGEIGFVLLLFKTISIWYVFTHFVFLVCMIPNDIGMASILRSSMLSRKYKLVFFLLCGFFIALDYLILLYPIFNLIYPKPASYSYLDIIASLFSGISLVFTLILLAQREIDVRERTGKSRGMIRKLDPLLMKYEQQETILMCILLPGYIILGFILAAIIYSVLTTYHLFSHDLNLFLSVIPFMILIFHMVFYAWSLNNRYTERFDEVIKYFERKKLLIEHPFGEVKQQPERENVKYTKWRMNWKRW